MKSNGFTLLEILIVIGIMGLIAAMVWPMRAVMDDSQRERVTIDKMDSIVEAIIGHDQLKDTYDMSRIIGGYVGDMGDWPDLFEPGGSGLGGFRGTFDGGRFRWSPFESVPDTKKESLGQPRGLWTKEKLDADDRKKWKGPYLTPPVTRNPALGRHYAKNQAEYEALDLTDREYFHLLQGSEQLTDGWNRAFRFFITDGGETFCIVSLGPRGFGYEDDFEQDCDSDSPENQGKIVRALRKSDWEAVRAQSSRRSTVVTKLIFLTEDRIEQDIVRALIGESPSGPNTGYTGDLLDWPELFNWVCRFGRANPEDEFGGGDPFPCDGTICQDGSTNHWEVQPGEVRDADGNILSGSYVRGTTGSIETRTCVRVNGILQCTNQNEQLVSFDCDLPEGIWERQWRDPNSATTADYTYGQPRGLWDSESIEPVKWRENKDGIGWRTPYLPKPIDNHAKPNAAESEEYIADAFDQPLHFFKLDDKDAFLILSGGDSGGFFYDYGVSEEVFEFPQRTFVYSGLDPNERITKRVELTQEYLERKKQDFKIDDYQPDSTEEVNTPSGTGFYDNRDNITRLVRRSDWRPGFLTINELIVNNVGSCPQTKCVLRGVVDALGVQFDPVLQCGSHGAWDPIAHTWTIGGGGSPPAFSFPNHTSNQIVTGGRYLVCWEDGDGNDLPDTGEPGWWRIFSTYGHPGINHPAAGVTVSLSALDFQPLP